MFGGYAHCSFHSTFADDDDDDDDEGAEVQYQEEMGRRELADGAIGEGSDDSNMDQCELEALLYSQIHYEPNDAGVGVSPEVLNQSYGGELCEFHVEEEKGDEPVSPGPPPDLNPMRAQIELSRIMEGHNQRLYQAVTSTDTSISRHPSGSSAKSPGTKNASKGNSRVDNRLDRRIKPKDFGGDGRGQPPLPVPLQRPTYSSKVDVNKRTEIGTTSPLTVTAGPTCGCPTEAAERKSKNGQTKVMAKEDKGKRKKKVSKEDASIADSPSSVKLKAKENIAKRKKDSSRQAEVKVASEEHSPLVAVEQTRLSKVKSKKAEGKGLKETATHAEVKGASQKVSTSLVEIGLTRLAKAGQIKLSKVKAKEDEGKWKTKPTEQGQVKDGTSEDVSSSIEVGQVGLSKVRTKKDKAKRKNETKAALPDPKVGLRKDISSVVEVGLTSLANIFKGKTCDQRFENHRKKKLKKDKKNEVIVVDYSKGVESAVKECSKRKPKEVVRISSSSDFEVEQTPVVKEKKRQQLEIIQDVMSMEQDDVSLGSAGDAASVSDSETDSEADVFSINLDSVDIHLNVENAEEDAGMPDDEWDVGNMELKEVHGSLGEGSWAIVDEDRYPKINSSRYHGLMRVHCRNCNEKGHMQKDCPKPKKQPVCMLCGAVQHATRLCPQRACYNCERPGHAANDCEAKRRRWYEECYRCGMQGHTKTNCSDVWRQFHLTTKIGALVQSPQKGNRRMFCCNCGRKGHFGYECERVKMNKYQSPLSPFVSKYLMPSATDGRDEPQGKKRKVKDRRQEEETTPKKRARGNDKATAFAQTFTNLAQRLKKKVSSSAKNKAGHQQHRDGQHEGHHEGRSHTHHEGHQDNPHDRHWQGHHGRHHETYRRGQRKNHLADNTHQEHSSREPKRARGWNGQPEESKRNAWRTKDKQKAKAHQQARHGASQALSSVRPTGQAGQKKKKKKRKAANTLH